MFGSTVLEVVIGLVFIYLALSLICSGLNEYYSALLSRRSRHLAEAIAVLFNKDDPRGRGLLAEFVKHPLITGLSDVPAVAPRAVGVAAAPPGEGAAGLPSIRGQLRSMTKGFPSYIPDRIFADALIDVLAKGEAAPATPELEAETAKRLWDAAEAGIRRLRGAIGALPDAASKTELTARLDEQARALEAERAKPLTPDQIRAEVVGAAQTVRGAVEMLPPDAIKARLLEAFDREATLLAGAEDDLITARNLRAAVATLPDSQVKRALGALMDEYGDDIRQIKANIETWFNDSMDRVSGWYKKNTQLILAVIAVLVTAGLNADSLAIGSRLIKDSATRATAQAAARSIEAATLASKGDDPAAIRAQVQSLNDQLARMNLPLGWTDGDLGDLGIGPARPAGDGPRPSLGGAWFRKVAGLLLTALALTMGAPFWFDVLNRLVNLRVSRDKPAEAPKPA